MWIVASMFYTIWNSSARWVWRLCLQWVKLSITWCTCACVLGGGTWEHLVATYAILMVKFTISEWYRLIFLKLTRACSWRRLTPLKWEVGCENLHTRSRWSITMPGILLVNFVVKLLSTYTIHYPAEDTREERHYPWWRYLGIQIVHVEVKVHTANVKLQHTENKRRGNT